MPISHPWVAGRHLGLEPEDTSHTDMGGKAPLSGRHGAQPNTSLAAAVAAVIAAVSMVFLLAWIVGA